MEDDLKKSIISSGTQDLFTPEIYFVEPEVRLQWVKKISCGTITSPEQGLPYDVLYWATGVNWMKVFCIAAVVPLLWCFLFSLTLMSDAFKALGGKDAATFLKDVDNPVAGVMIGTLATVLLQSSSTTTSILVAMVDAEAISIRQGIPMVMGANIGTTVTNTIVSFGHVQNPEELARAFSGATVHDVFNLMNVAFFLPLEAASHFLEEFSKVLIENIQQEDGDKWEGPVKKIVGAYSKRIINVNKDKLKDIASDKCDAYCKDKSCKPASTYFFGKYETGVLDVEGNPIEEYCGLHPTEGSKFIEEYTYTTPGYSVENIFPDFTDTYNVGSDYWELTDASVVDTIGCSVTKCKKLPVLDDLIAATTDVDDLAALNAYDMASGGGCKKLNSEPCEGSLIKGGVLTEDWEWSDSEAGGVALAASLFILLVCVIGMVKILTRVMKGPASLWLNKALGYNGYVAMLIGLLVTLLVQSSSVTTSTLTPLVGIGVIDVHQMFPLTLGANVGTTGTGLLAALVSTKPEALQLAFCHLFFNIFGILLWYPIPSVRQIPINASLFLGRTTATYRWFPFAYTGIVFVAIPAAIWGISQAAA